MTDISADDEPKTLSGRPAVSELAPSGPTPTRVSRPVIVVVTLFLVAVLVFAGLAFLRSGPDGTDVRQMAAGQCYTEVDTVVDDGRVIPHGNTTPCTEGAPRIVAVVPLALGPYPGPDGLNRIVADRCGGDQTRVIAPTENTWVHGDRTVVCIADPA